MTQLEYNNYIVQLQYISSTKGTQLANYLAIGKDNLNNLTVNLELLNAYIDILLSYTLELESVEDEDTINFFTREEMQSIVTNVNSICGTHYNIDFILDS